MKIAEIIIFVALVEGFPSISLCQVAGGKVEEQQDYSFAVGLYRDGQYELALQQFRSLLKNYPNSQRIDEITFLSGECLIQMKMYDSALIDYRNVMENYPGSSYFTRSELRSGEVSVQLNEFDKAEKLLKEVLSGNTDDALKGEASYKLGQMFVDKEDYTNAIKYFQLSYEGYKNSGFADYALYGKAWCTGKLSEYTEAKEEFQEMLADYPDSKLKADATEKIGECDFFQGNYQKAIQEFSNSTAISSEEQVAEPALYYEGRSYEAADLPDSAGSVYTEYMNKFPSGDHSDEVRVFLSKILIAEKSHAREALELLSKVEHKNPVYFDARLETAHAYETAGSPDSAELTLNELTKPPNSLREISSAYYELGKLYYNEKSYSKSVESFLNASPDTSLYPEAMKNAAISAAAGGDYKNAKVYFLNAIMKLQREELLTAHFDYAAALYATKDYDGAAQIYLAAEKLASSPPEADAPLAHDKEQSEALYMAAESFYGAKNYSSSLTDYKKYLQAYPNGTHSATALFGVGYSYYFSNEFTNAAHIFQQFVDSYPNSPLLSDAYLRLGDAYFYNKDYEKALGVYQEAATKFQADTSTAYAVYQVGESNFWLGRLDAATAAFRSLLKNYPESSIVSDAQFAIGWVYFSQKQYPQAISEFKNTVLNYPNSAAAARALYSQGDAYYNLQNYDDALASYQRLLAKYPTSDYVDNAIVGMQYCLTVLGRTKEAETVTDDFVRAHPQLAHIDRIYYKKAEYGLNQKHYTEAERDLREFIVKFPKSEILGKALYNLALVEINLGREKAAIGILSDLIDKQPWDEYTDAGRIKLAEIYQGQKEYTVAQKLLENAAASGDVYGTKAQTDLGKLYLAEGDTLKAESTLSKAALTQSDSSALEVHQPPAENNEDRDEAKILLSSIYFNRGRSEDAISLANSVAKTRDDTVGADAQLKVAEYYCDYGDTSNAVLSFLRVKYVYASFTDIVAESQLELADCLAKSGNKREARALLRDFIKGRADDSFTKLAREKLEEFGAD